MKISGVSNVLNKHITSTLLNKNNSANKQNNPLEKQKAQIQQQISDVENSNLSKEEKNAKIKELQKNLQETEQKEMEQKVQKKLENPESKNTDKKSQLENDRKLELKDDEDNKGLNKDVVFGLASASGHMKIGKVAYAVYKDAKFKGKMDVAERALSYASGELKESRKSTKLVAKAIGEYKKQLRNAKKEENPADNVDKTSIDTSKKASTDNTIKENVVTDNLNNSTDTNANKKIS
ncbi:hypothetical protein HBE96_20700 [Clostridium sp. P21]|uniref:Uncharacterized protein n=1 Tax=Clostridium muellerianum TaxID=2716538 RepID=A0A7Y0EK88_9CLOT|nr:hypothetical protein [Clostridium muellerianum]NMM65014.1 hypothetical protein [Clostridium muellerianum]